MKKILVAAIAALTMGASAFAGGDIAPVETVIVEAPAAKNLYVGVSGQATIQTTEISDTFDSVAWDNAKYGVGIQAGYVFFRSGDFSTALEGRYTYSWDEVNGVDLDTGILSGFLKPAYDFGPVTGYALIGYSQVDLDVLGTSDGFAWGLGISGDVTDSIEVFMDVTVNPDFNNGVDTILLDVDHEVITLGVNYRF